MNDLALDRRGIEHQLKKVKIPGLCALALSALWLSVKPVLNLQNSRPITGFPWLKRRRGSLLFAPLSVCAFLQPALAAVIALLSPLSPRSISSRFREFRHGRSEIRPTKLVLGSRPAARDALLRRRPLQSGKCIPPHPLARSPFEETTYTLRLRPEKFPSPCKRIVAFLLE